MEQAHTVYIALGSNMGDRLGYCQTGIAALTESGKCTLKAQSPYYLTEPVDYKEQDWFLNAVIKIKTSFEPTQLLELLQEIQRNSGRKSDVIRFGPRVLDLDIIFYDDLIFKTADLEIPHPRMHKRRFVLKPICDIDPKTIHPILKKDVRYLLDSLHANDQKTILYK
ncbi:2-amino-4-hydroxy-6-hydroxymethyldihydropteridine diphosphokinase [Thermodesulfobacteriota bacterium]